MTSSADQYAAIVRAGPWSSSRSIALAPTIGHGGGSCCASCALGRTCESQCPAAGPVVGVAPTWTTVEDVKLYTARLDGSIKAFDAEASSKVVTEDWDPDAQQKTLDEWKEKIGSNPMLKGGLARMQERVTWARKARAGKAPEQIAKDLEWGRAWRAFVTRWETFVAEDHTLGGMVEMKAYWNAIEAFDSEYTELRKRYAAAFGPISTPAPPTPEDIIKEHPPDKDSPTGTVGNALDTVKSIVPWIAAAAVAGAIATVLKK